MRSMTGADWADSCGSLLDAPTGDSADDLIDERLLTEAEASTGHLDADVLEAAGRYWRLAVSKASSVLTRRGACLALALCAGSSDQDAVDLIVAQYRASLDSPRSRYLTPELLKALSVLAERNPLAETELLSLLQRLKSDSPRYLAIKAAKIIGNYEVSRDQPTPTLRSKIEEWIEVDDLAVSGEAYFQIGIMALNDALRASELSNFAAKLSTCHAAFAKASASEEGRDDARIFAALIDLLRAFPVIPNTQGLSAKEIRQRCDNLERIIFGHDRMWNGMASHYEGIVQYRLLSVARTMTQISELVASSDNWTNFDEALTEVAALFLMLRGSSRSSARFNDPLRHIADPVAGAHFGPLLDRAVSRVRFTKVLEHRIAQNGDDAIAGEIRALSKAAAENEYAGFGDFTLTQMNSYFEAAKQSPVTLAQFFSCFSGAREQFSEAIPDNLRSLDSLRDFSLPLPIDNPSCYGDDPIVNEVAVKVFEAASVRLGSTYSRPKWERFREVVVFAIKCAVMLRDDGIPFTLSSDEPDGFGRDARERDLQNFMRTQLVYKYGTRDVYYEQPQIAAGRVDLVVRFPECAIPIEIKAVFRENEISRSHIDASFLRQCELYATDRDRIALLLILDVRPSNAQWHRKRAVAQTTPEGLPDVADRRPRTDVNSKPYSLVEGFWVTGLPSDSREPDSKLNAIVVGLIPANRSKPSSSSTYSNPPRRIRNSAAT